ACAAAVRLRRPRPRLHRGTGARAHLHRLGHAAVREGPGLRGRAVSLGPGAAGGAASPARCLLRLPLRPLEEGAALHPRSQGRHGRGLPVRDEARNAIIDDPPHILLANYVMLEYMLIRPAERTLI